MFQRRVILEQSELGNRVVQKAPTRREQHIPAQLKIVSPHSLVYFQGEPVFKNNYNRPILVGAS